MSSTKKTPDPASQTQGAQSILDALQDPRSAALAEALACLPKNSAKGVKSAEGEPILSVALNCAGEARRVALGSACGAPRTSRSQFNASAAASVKLLLEAGADPSDIDSKGCAALHKALGIAGRNRKPSAELCQMLIDSGADPLALDASGHSPLHLACKLGDAPLIKLFAGLGADIEQPLASTLSRPAHLAAMCQSMPALEALLELGADFRALDAQGRDPAALLAVVATELDRWGGDGQCARSLSLKVAALAERQLLDRSSGLGAPCLGRSLSL